MSNAVEKANPWPEAKIAQLRKLWDAGLSCSQIAKEIGGTTRNAVIGKVHRLGLSGRVNPAVVRVQKQRDHRAEYARRLRPPVNFSNGSLRERLLPPPLLIDAPESRRLTIIEVGARECRFPSEHDGAQHLFCGQPTLGGSYCPYHHARLSSPPEPRQKARAA